MMFCTGHKTPVAAVQALVAIVAEDEVLAARDDQLAILDEGAQLRGPGDADVFIEPVAARKIIAKFIGDMLFEDDVGLRQERAH